MKRKKISYCPHCNKRAMHNIEIAKKIAQDRDGYCLSSEYINNKNNLLWRYSKGHEWYACLNSIKNRNSWCQLCSKYKREKICYDIVSKYHEFFHIGDTKKFIEKQKRDQLKKELYNENHIAV